MRNQGEGPADILTNRLSGQPISKDAIDMQKRQERINLVFRDLAIYETSSIDDKVSELLAAKVQEVKAAHPDLDDVEAYAVAGRLLKQLVACYQSALNQLLP